MLIFLRGFFGIFLLLVFGCVYADEPSGGSQDTSDEPGVEAPCPATDIDKLVDYPEGFAGGMGGRGAGAAIGLFLLSSSSTGMSLTNEVNEQVEQGSDAYNERLYRAYVCHNYPYIEQESARHQPGDAMHGVAKSLNVKIDAYNRYFADIQSQFEGIFVDWETAAKRLREIAQPYIK